MEGDAYAGPHCQRNVIVGQANSNDAAYRHATGAGLAAIVAGVIFAFHYQQRQNLMMQGAFGRGASALVVRAYFYAVCFATALVVLVSASVAVYGIFKIIGPGVYGTGPHSQIRDEGIAELVSFAYLAGASAVIFLVAWQRSGSRRPRTEASGTIPSTGAPQ